jgi:hypothetical protein
MIVKKKKWKINTYETESNNSLMVKDGMNPVYLINDPFPFEYGSGGL